MAITMRRIREGAELAKQLAQAADKRPANERLTNTEISAVTEVHGDDLWYGLGQVKDLAVGERPSITLEQFNAQVDSIVRELDEIAGADHRLTDIDESNLSDEYQGFVSFCSNFGFQSVDEILGEG
jgi:hypothetical protein